MANILKNSGSRLEKIKRTRLPLSVWLAFLLLVTLTVGSTLARYNTSVSGDTTARVAKFEMEAAEAAGQADTIDLKAGYDDSGTYSFTVTNNSEVRVQYSVIVKNVPAYVEVTAQQGSGTKQTRVSDGSDMTFPFKELDIGAANDWTLTFKAQDNAEAVNAQTVSVSVYTEQVD